MRELAMMPTALRGERLPALAPFATKSAPRNGEKRICAATAAAERRDERDTRDRTGADRGHREGDREEQPGHDPRVAAREAHRAARHPRERAVGLGGREQAA